MEEAGPIVILCTFSHGSPLGFFFSRSDVLSVAPCQHLIVGGHKSRSLIVRNKGTTATHSILSEGPRSKETCTKCRTRIVLTPNGIWKSSSLTSASIKLSSPFSCFRVCQVFAFVQVRCSCVRSSPRVDLPLP